MACVASETDMVGLWRRQRGGGDGQVIANANGNLVVICVCAGLGVHRRAIASARSPDC